MERWGGGGVRRKLMADLLLEILPRLEPELKLHVQLIIGHPEFLNLYTINFRYSHFCANTGGRETVL